MKAAIILPLILASLALSSLTLSKSVTAEALSPEQMDMVIQMSVNQMKAEGEFAKMATCTNQTEAKVESVFSTVMRTCVEKHMLDEDDAKTTACLVSNFSEKLGISVEKFTACTE
ncbi:hypothetical protein L2735_11205 [Shewanella olleyana]|uniref:hypothetical protein n=1 Tax=Shewanella olleyana TaxID=135626 RepID=UPI00200D3F31|nr:hypothetical protein [Shewanella olleyana]MCL1067372.1 hypothetical protein [Shewanella olleyana]